MESLTSAAKETEPEYLATVLADLGPDSCDRNMFFDILQQLRPMLQGNVENPVAQALIFMSKPANNAGFARTQSSVWNTALFGSAALESVKSFRFC
jgi:hypothetical protein